MTWRLLLPFGQLFLGDTLVGDATLSPAVVPSSNTLQRVGALGDPMHASPSGVRIGDDEGCDILLAPDVFQKVIASQVFDLEITDISDGLQLAEPEPERAEVAEQEA